MKHWQVGVVMGIAWTVGAVCVQAQAKPPAEMVNAQELATPPGYSHAAVVSGGRMVFVAGQVGMNKAGEMVSKDDFRAQVEQAFRNLKAVLAAAGAKPENVVKLNYYVVGINHDKLLALRAVRDGFVDAKHPPVSTLAGVESLFREDCQFEVEAVAVVP